MNSFVGRAYLTGYSQTGYLLDQTALRWTVLVRQTEDMALEGAVDLQRRMLGWPDLDAWRARADHAMYTIKRTGKNGVALAGPA